MEVWQAQSGPLRLDVKVIGSVAAQTGVTGQGCGTSGQHCSVGVGGDLKFPGVPNGRRSGRCGLTLGQANPSRGHFD